MRSCPLVIGLCYRTPSTLGTIRYVCLRVGLSVRIQADPYVSALHLCGVRIVHLDYRFYQELIIVIITIIILWTFGFTPLCGSFVQCSFGTNSINSHSVDTSEGCWLWTKDYSWDTWREYCNAGNVMCVLCAFITVCVFYMLCGLYICTRAYYKCFLTFMTFKLWQDFQKNGSQPLNYELYGLL